MKIETTMRYNFTPIGKTVNKILNFFKEKDVLNYVVQMVDIFNNKSWNGT